MTEHLTRRNLISGGTTAALLAWGAGPAAGDTVPPDSFPTTAPERAKEMVGVSHSNLERVRELLAEDPGLALSAWDWGFGDWETALGAASHVGRLDIVEILLASGARPDLFTLAALDRVDAVRAVCSALPGCQRRRGPHGITLLAHARNGEAKRVEAFLLELGGADEREPHLALAEQDGERYLGSYRESPDGRTWTVDRHRTGDLQLGVDGGSPRMLRHLGDHTFTPAGAPQVRVRFEVEGERARTFEISHSSLPTRAVRIDG